MRKIFFTSILAAAFGSVSLVASVAASDELPEGIETVAVKPASKDHPFDEVRSGWTFRAPEKQSLQMDDFENPAFLWVEKGEELWSTVDGEAGKSCQSCHDDASETMKQVGAAMPKWDEKQGKPMTMEQRINNCRTENMKADEWKWESENMLSMSSYVRNQSRGEPVKVQVDGPMQSWWQKGKDLYYTRVGQLNMACANCHEDNFGKYIRADHLSQGHSNGFPTYRLKWQKLGSLHRRFSGCMKNIRAKPYKRGSEEFVALELYLAWRGEGLPVETPAVRQ